MDGKLIGNKDKNVYNGKTEPLIEWTVPRRQMPGGGRGSGGEFEFFL